VLDRNGEALAVSTPVKSIWAIPSDVALKGAEQRKLAALLGMPERELDRKLGAARDFVYLKRQVPPETAEAIAALRLGGIYESPEYRRYYPAGEVTAPLIDLGSPASATLPAPADRFRGAFVLVDPQKVGVDPSFVMRSQLAKALANAGAAAMLLPSDKPGRMVYTPPSVSIPALRCRSSPWQRKTPRCCAAFSPGTRCASRSM